MYQESIHHADASAHGYLCTPDGARMRYGCWPVDESISRGSVVVVGGRSEFLEKYSETIDTLCKRGFDAFSLDWRGQGLSERMLPNPQKGYIEDYEVYIRDMAFFLEQIVYPQSRGDIYVLAHSMGGHITIRFIKEHTHRIRRLILSAPMIDIKTQPAPPFVVRWLSRCMVRLGFADKCIIGSGRHNPFIVDFANNRLTTDRHRFLRNASLVEGNPAMAAGRVTYGWLAATFRSIDLLKQASFCDGIDIPILIALSAKDEVVSNKAIRKLAARLSHHQIVVFEEARHEILQEVDSVQSQFWRAFDDFINA